MKNLGDENNYAESNNWDVVEVSKVNDKIIRKLLDYLKYDISDKFFISFESLLKLGNKVPEATIKNIISELEQTHNFKKELFQFILNFTKDDTVEYHLLPQIYSPDFIVRARAVMKIKENNDVRYLKFLLPLLDDPDDSVRWSAIKFLSQNIDNPIIHYELKRHLNKELNPIISENLKDVFEKE
ncbi:MAG: HEAT repeat domain-containing protein [Promethearchaeota archaeon]|nr:HEAT repeat domain-containing protein [Candidatus Lokiarchaeota archaeon]